MTGQDGIRLQAWIEPNACSCRMRSRCAATSLLMRHCKLHCCTVFRCIVELLFSDMLRGGGRRKARAPLRSRERRWIVKQALFKQLRPTVPPQETVHAVHVSFWEHPAASVGMHSSNAVVGMLMNTEGDLKRTCPPIRSLVPLENARPELHHAKACIPG